ncbi:MAG: shikimate dehydrogenase [Phycisphaerae bacterium]|nr:shikimate dehydrogenase [Phycisphaerae bacterium]
MTPQGGADTLGFVMEPQLPKTRLICTLTATTIEAMADQMLQAAATGCDTVECRLDYLSPPPSPADIAAFLDGPPLDVIATCRPVREGGKFDGSETDRLAILQAAAATGASYIDVEADVPPDERPDGIVISSRHDFETCPDDLADLAAGLDNSDAAVNKIAFAAARPSEALRAFDVIRDSRKPTIALAMGPAGLTSRILAGKFGAFGTFASLADGLESAPGQPTVAALRDLYRWDAIDADTEIYGVIGCPVGHSMSPAIHNAAFGATGINGVYVPLLIEPGSENFNDFLDAVLARPWLNWRGLSVTIPHKHNACEFVGAENCDPLAVRIGAVNTITISPQGEVRGDNTDYAAAIDALCDAMGIAREDLSGREVAVLGAGGAARAIVAALAHYNARTTVYNRTVARAEALAAEFGASADGLGAAESMQAEIVINCTPIGMHPVVDASPLDRIPESVKVVFDTIYNPIRTKLLAAAEEAQCLTVTGLDMFVNQAVAQFGTWTAQEAPRDVMRQVVMQHLDA